MGGRRGKTGQRTRARPVELRDKRAFVRKSAFCTKKLISLDIPKIPAVAPSVGRPLYHTWPHLSRVFYSSFCTKKIAPIKWGQDKRSKCGRHLQGQKRHQKSGHSCGMLRGVCECIRLGNNFPCLRRECVRNRKHGQ